MSLPAAREIRPEAKALGAALEWRKVDLDKFYTETFLHKHVINYNSLKQFSTLEIPWIYEDIHDYVYLHIAKIF